METPDLKVGDRVLLPARVVSVENIMGDWYEVWFETEETEGAKPIRFAISSQRWNVMSSAKLK